MASLYVENPDYRFCVSSEPLQRPHDRQDGEKFGFVNDYVSSVGHLWLRSLVDEPQYGFTISCINELGWDFEAHTPPANMEEPGSLVGLENTFVLPDNVEIVQGKKRVVRSLVRFATFKQFSVGTGQLAYEFGPGIIPGREVVGAVGDREIDFPGVEHEWLPVIDSPSDHIETTTDGVDVSSGLNIERKRQGIFFDRKKDVFRVVRWQLTDHCMDVIAAPGFETLRERWEIGFGPIYRRLSV